MVEQGLRVGIVGSSHDLKHWQVACLRSLREVPGVELVFFAEAAVPPQGQKHSFLYDRWLARRPAARSSDGAEVSRFINAIPRIHLGESPAANDPGILQDHPPDLLLQFSADELPESYHALPRYGIWRFVHGGGHSGAEDIPGLREMLAGETHITASLYRSHSSKGHAAILRSGSFGMSGRSIDEIAEIVLQVCASWPAQICRAFIAGDAKAIVGTGTGPAAFQDPWPTNAEMFRLWWQEFTGKRKAGSQRDLEEWNFGVLPQPITSLLEERPSLNVRWLPPPGGGRWRSTPFGCMKDGQLSVLYEKYDHVLGKAVIGRLRPKRDNNLKRSRDLLVGKSPLSYPFILEHEGEVFVIPEEAGGGNVTLYNLNEEQTTLTPVRTLLEEALYSPTVFQHDGRWWLFGTKAPMENTVLHAYYSEQLDGPYTAHSLNPIKTDIRSARPGGTPFRRGEELWRPAQDHSSPDGIRIALNRIMVLSPAAFAEETVRFFEPLKAPWSKGIRTLSAVGDITLVDGMRHATGKSAPKPGRKRAVQKGRKSEHDDLNAL